MNSVKLTKRKPIPYCATLLRMPRTFKGAIEDFRFFVEWLKQNGEYERFDPTREAWIAELEAGRNPFDAEVYEAS